MLSEIRGCLKKVNVPARDGNVRSANPGTLVLMEKVPSTYRSVTASPDAAHTKVIDVSAS